MFEIINHILTEKSKFVRAFNIYFNARNFENRNTELRARIKSTMLEIN